MTLEKITAQLRLLLGAARVAEADVHSACRDIRTLSTSIYSATTYLEAGRREAPLAAAREIVGSALRRFSDVRRAVDAAELDLTQEADRTLEPAPECRIIVDTIRSIAEVTEELGEEIGGVGDSAADRVRALAEFDSLQLRVAHDLDGADLNSVDDGLERLRALEFDLVSTASTAALEELTWRRMMLDPLLGGSSGA